VRVAATRAQGYNGSKANQVHINIAIIPSDEAGTQAGGGGRRRARHAAAHGVRLELCCGSRPTAIIKPVGRGSGSLMDLRLPSTVSKIQNSKV